jgi:heme/copper-type cytochrome/quinol oxidase subunit 4
VILLIKRVKLGIYFLHLQKIKKKEHNMKPVIRLLLLLMVIALLYMLFLSVRQGMRAKNAAGLTIIEQTDADRNSRKY